VLDRRVSALHQGVIELRTKDRIAPDRGGNPLSGQPQAGRDARVLAADPRAVKELRPDRSHRSTQSTHPVQLVFCPWRSREAPAADPRLDDMLLDTNALSSDSDVAQGRRPRSGFDAVGVMHRGSKKIQDPLGDDRGWPSERGSDRLLCCCAQVLSELQTRIGEGKSCWSRGAPNDESGIP
jgi:hypothetical protein